MKINENTNIGLPLRNLIGLIGAIIIGAWFAFGVIERLNQLETKNQLFEKDLLEASVQKPIDQEQFMILEWQATQIEKMQSILEKNLHTNVMLDNHEKEIEKLKKDIEKLKDATRDIKFANGNGAH
jgi:HAMP domain-containing protein